MTGQQQIKEKTINKFQDQGLDLNQRNYDMVIKVLEEMRRLKVVYDSETAVEMAELLLGLDDQKLNDFLDNLPKLLPHVDELKEIPSLNGIEMDDLLDMLGEGENKEGD